MSNPFIFQKLGLLLDWCILLFTEMEIIWMSQASQPEGPFPG